MPHDITHDDDLLRLAAAMCDDTATPADIAELEQLLDGDRAAQQQFIEYVETHASLSRRWRGEALMTDDFMRMAAAEDEASSDEPTVHIPQRRFRASRHKLSISISVAIAVMASTLLAMHLMDIGPFVAEESNKPNAAETEDTEGTFVATLSNWHNDQWLENTRPPRRDPRLKAGTRLVLASGLVEIAYDTGAVVVLEGPAEYEVAGEKSGYIRVGKLTARVDGENAKGFNVKTPTATVEDLGTEFGVDVAMSGATYVQVFEGRVRLDSEADGAADESLELAAGDAGRVGVDTTTVQSATTNDVQFVRGPLRTTGDLLLDEFNRDSDAWRTIDIHTFGSDRTIGIPSTEGSHSVETSLVDGRLIFSGRGPTTDQFYDAGTALISHATFALPQDGSVYELTAKLDSLRGSAQQCLAGIGITDEKGSTHICYVRRPGSGSDDLLVSSASQLSGDKANYADEPKRIRLPDRIAIRIDSEGKVQSLVSGESLSRGQVDPEQFESFRVIVFATARTSADDVHAVFDGVRLKKRRTQVGAP